MACDERTRQARPLRRRSGRCEPFVDTGHHGANSVRAARPLVQETSDSVTHASVEQQNGSDETSPEQASIEARLLANHREG